MIEFRRKIEMPNTEIVADGGKGREQTETNPAIKPEEKDLDKKQQESSTRENPNQKDGNEEHKKQKPAGI